MSNIVLVEAYSEPMEKYLNCVVEVDMHAHGVGGWMLRKVDGVPVSAEDTYAALGIDPITYDQVDAAAQLQLRNER